MQARKGRCVLANVRAKASVRGIVPFFQDNGQLSDADLRGLKETATSAEITFFDDPEVCVTNLRLLMAGKSLLIAEVASVGEAVNEGTRSSFPVHLLLTGLVGMLLGVALNSPALSIVCAPISFCGAAWVAATRKTYLVSVAGPAGDVLVLKSQNADLARAVEAAIARAVALRVQPGRN